MPKTRSRMQIVRTIQAELAPFPGRLSGSLRDTVGIIVALLAAMTLRVPGISLALAILFMLQRERPGLSLRSGLNIFGGAALACVCSLVWVQMTDGTDVTRFFGMMLGIFIAAIGMSGTSFALLFTNFGFYGFLDLAAWDAHQRSGAIVASNLHNLASLAIVLASAIAVEYLFGVSHPADELKLEMQRRRSALARFFRALASDGRTLQRGELRSLQNAVVQYAHAGDRHLNKLYNRFRDDSSDVSQVPIGIHYRIGLLTRVLEKSALLSLTRQRNAGDAAYLIAIAELCERQLPDTEQPQIPFPVNAPPLLKEIQSELTQYFASMEHRRDNIELVEQEPIRRTPLLAGFFLPNAFKTPDVTVRALKLTLAVMTCYVFYNAVAWPGILTCVVTVLFTGLSSTGAMKQKQLYRFSGGAIGAALGIATVSLLFPNMDSITSLVVVAGAVSFLSGWVLRSPKMGYVGVQIGFAFFLTTLPGFDNATLIAPARDRVIGIALGILVMWFIFDQLWPLRTSKALGQILERVGEAAIRLRYAASQKDDRKRARTLSKLRASMSLELASMQQLESAARFEFGPDHKRELAACRRLVRKIEEATADFYRDALLLSNSTNSDEP